MTKRPEYIHKVTGEKISYWNGVVPHNPLTGRPMSYEHSVFKDYVKQELVWKDNAPFFKAVEFVGFERGRSAAHSIFKDSKDESERPWQFQMFLTDLQDLIVGEVNIRRFEGMMAYTKRGSNYGFALLELSPA